MDKKILLRACLLALLAGALTFTLALAHDTVHAGKYDIEVGWVDEPPVIGQRNALVVNVADTSAAGAVVDVSKLLVSVTYGGQTKTLTLQPLGEDTANKYVAPLLPTIPGQYTVQLRGKLGDADVNADVQPEEVATVDALSFPSAEAAQAQRGAGSNAAFGTATWLSGAALLVSLVALVLGVLALRKSRS